MFDEFLTLLFSLCSFPSLSHPSIRHIIDILSKSLIKIHPNQFKSIASHIFILSFSLSLLFIAFIYIFFVLLCLVFDSTSSVFHAVVKPSLVGILFDQLTIFLTSFFYHKVIFNAQLNDDTSMLSPNVLVYCIIVNILVSSIFTCSSIYTVY